MDKIIYTLAIFALPLFANAQSLQNLMSNTLGFISGSIIPFLFGIAFLFIVVNVFRYLVLDGDNKDARDNAKSLIIYGVGAFIFLVTFYGLVNLLAGTTGLEGEKAVKPDYFSK